MLWGHIPAAEYRKVIVGLIFLRYISSAFAAQINMSKNSLFMHGTMISDLLNISGDVHHILPKAYLKNNGVTAKSRYNQVANYTYLDTQVNKAISDDAPSVYFKTVMDQFGLENPQIGNITNKRLIIILPKTLYHLRSQK